MDYFKIKGRGRELFFFIAKKESMDKFVNVSSRFLDRNVSFMDSSKNRPFNVKQHGTLNECYRLAHYYTGEGREEGIRFYRMCSALKKQLKRIPVFSTAR